MSSGALSSPGDTERLRVLVVDPEDIVVWGFKSLLFEEPWVDEVAGATDASQALGVLAEFRPHLVLVDVDLIEEPSSRFADAVRAQLPSARLLLTSSRNKLAPYAKAIGADGAIRKDWRAEAIAAAVRTAGLGVSVFEVDTEQASLLTGREANILRLLASGATNNEVAAHVNLSPNTVKDHVRSVYRKLGARNRAEAVSRAGQLGLLGPGRAA